MPKTPDFFRDFGILPYGKTEPPEHVRSFFSTGTVIGQFIGTGLMLGFGLGMAVLFALLLPFPFNLLAPPVPLLASGAAVYFVTRNDYAWIELDGEIIRAKHLYTRRVIERPIEEIEDLLTLVIQARTLTVKVVEAWLGRVRGVEIRFQDKRRPLRISRSDPAMKNAKELVEALIYRMWQTAPVDAEIINLREQPLVRRIFWDDDSR